MKATGLTHGPFYNHFSSKEAMMAESVDHGLQGILDGLEAVGNSPEGKAKYIEDYLNAVHRDAPGEGCAVAALASEVRHAPQVRGPFTTQLKAIVEKMKS